jgi:hypothetical protein
VDSASNHPKPYPVTLAFILKHFLKTFPLRSHLVHLVLDNDVQPRRALSRPWLEAGTGYIFFWKQSSGTLDLVLTEGEASDGGVLFCFNCGSPII